MKEFDCAIVKEMIRENMMQMGLLGHMFTWKEGEHDWHPANDIGPGEPPVSIAFPIVVYRHTSVHSHCQKH